MWEDSEYYNSFDESMRNEFLFRIFQHLVIGGELCQYEDNVEPYFKATTALYKDMVTVYKDSETDEVKVGSHAFAITNVADTNLYIERDHPMNYLYLTISPDTWHVNVWYHKDKAHW